MKRNVILISGVIVVVLVMMFFTDIIIISEKIGEITHCKYVEYAIYILCIGLLVYFVAFPAIRILRMKPMPALSAGEDANKESLLSLGKQLASNFGYIQKADLRKQRKQDFLYELNHAYELEKLQACIDKEVRIRMEGDSSLDVKGFDFYIKETAKTVFMITAVSPNSKVDSFSTLVLNFNMMKNMILATGFRPSTIQMWRLYVRILLTTLFSYVVSEGLRDVGSIKPFSALDSIDVDVPESDNLDTDIDTDVEVGENVDLDGDSFSFSNILSNLRIPGAVVGPVLDGVSNALLTLRFGYVTHSYLLEGQELYRNRERVRAAKRYALKESIKALPSVLGEGSMVLGEGIQKVVNKYCNKIGTN